MRNHLPVLSPAPEQGSAAVKLRSCARLRQRKLARILRQAAARDGDVLFPLLASMLSAHLEESTYSDLRIRARLDELQLLVALELTHEGVA